MLMRWKATEHVKRSGRQRPDVSWGGGRGRPDLLAATPGDVAVLSAWPITVPWASRPSLGAYLDPDTVVSFEQFLSIVEQQDPVTDTDSHWRPQHIDLIHPLVTDDHVGRLETSPPMSSTSAKRPAAVRRA